MRAFTLIESLIYLALFPIIIYGALAGMYALTASTQINQTRADIETEGDFLLGKIRYDVTHAQSIHTPSPNATSSMLVLISDDGSTIIYKANASALTRTQNGFSLPLSETPFALTSLTFSSVASMSAGVSTQELQTTFQLSSNADNGQLYTETFSDSSYIFP